MPEQDESPAEDVLGSDRVHEVRGLCSRCGAAWPCLRCLTGTPPYVRIWNSC